MTINTMGTVTDWVMANVSPGFTASVHGDKTEFIFHIVDVAGNTEKAAEVSKLFDTPEDINVFNSALRTTTQIILNALYRDKAIDTQIRYLINSKLPTEDKVKMLNALMETDRVRELIYHLRIGGDSQC